MPLDGSTRADHEATRDMPEHEVPIRDAGALFHIAEPERHRHARARRPGWGAGIDLGTTHSLVAIAPNGASPRALADDEGESLLPSVVSYAGAEVEVGRRAQAEAVASPTRVIGSAKRFMGRAPADLRVEHPYAIPHHDERGEPARVIRIDVGEGRLVSPVEVSAEILGSLRHRAERELGGELDGVVITVPAYFDDAQRQATRDAGRLAGLRVYRLLAEPTAAALAYGLDRAEEGLFAVYDLGGGTFDVSVLRLHEGVFQVLATGGDSALGGDDFDRAIARVLFARAGVVEPTPTQLQEATIVARRAKEELSTSDSVRISLAHAGVADLPFTRAQLDELVAPAIARTIRICRAVLADAGIGVDELAGVVLVGGSTRMPRVRAEVERAFGRAPLCDIDPDRVVAYGAAIQADILSGGAREGVTLLDVVPLSLGIETMGGIVERIIPRNATIPISARQTFTNYSERQTAMRINVVQGERELAQDCRSLARFELRGIPRLPASMARIEVTFELDADALLTVTARELMTGTKQTVEVLPTYGLSAAEVDRLVDESLDHARADLQARSRAEARVELGRVVLAIQTALADVDGPTALHCGDEREAIASALSAAEAAMADPSLASDGITAARKQLERASEGFARRRMESALQSGMGGHTLAEIEGALADEEELARRRAPEQAETIEREP